jgi:hypothetical protein
MPRFWRIPEGLHVLPDGSWRSGELPVVHGASLQYLKAHLVFEDEGAFIVDGGRKMPVALEGPPFEVTRLTLDPAGGQARVVLDDGSEETLAEGSLGMNEETGRFECAVRGGHARAAFSRAAHQTLLEHVIEEGGTFSLRVGARRIPLRT